MKTLIFCSDGISKSSGFLTGGGLRSSQIIEIMKKFGHVDFVEPQSARNLHQDFGYAVTVESQQHWVNHFNPDFVYFLNASAAVLAQSPAFNLPFCVDIHGPIHIESCWINGGAFHNEVVKLKQTTHRADFITVANERQKYGLIYGGFLNNAEFMNSDHVIVIPVYMKNELSLMSENKDVKPTNLKNYVYSIGSIYPWHDYKTPFINLIEGLAKDQTFRLIGGPHSGLVNAIETNLFISDLQLHPRVEVFPQMPRASLDEHFRIAKCVVDLSCSNSERILAANTRVAEFLSLGIPTLVDQYSYFGEKLEEWGFTGLVVKDHKEDLVEKIRHLLKLEYGKLNQIRRKIHTAFKKNMPIDLGIANFEKILKNKEW